VGEKRVGHMGFDLDGQSEDKGAMGKIIEW